MSSLVQQLHLTLISVLSLALVGCDQSSTSSDAHGKNTVAEEDAPILTERKDALASFEGPVVSITVAQELGAQESNHTFATLEEAFAFINGTRAQIAGVDQADYVEPAIHLKIEPGVYREGELLIESRQTPVTVESSDASKEVIISGSDVWTDWTTVGETLQADWPYKWGELRFGGWPAGELKNLDPIGTRCEMVFVNGKLLRQVSADEKLKAGQFKVDHDSEKITLRLPNGVDPDVAKIEVAVRPHLLLARAVQGLTLRNLAFVHANNGDMHPGLGTWSVLLAGDQDDGTKDHGEAPILVNDDRAYLRNLLIENCRFEWNNGGGVSMANIADAQIFDSSFDNNGGSGVGINRGKNVLWEDCSFDQNNWRIGKLGKAYGWAPAGTKQLFMYNTTYRRCTFNRNYATGLWLDFGNENILVEDCIVADNWNVGFYFEASYGPCLVKNSVIVRNAVSDRHDFALGGVLFAESKSLTLENCLIADNANWQIGVRSRQRKSSGYFTKTRFDGLCEHLTVNNCVIRGGYYAPSNVPDWFTDAHRVSALIAPSVHSDQEWYKELIPTYKGDNNVFIQGHSEDVFGVGGNFGLTRTNFVGWQKLTGQDQNSTFHEVTPR